MGDETVKNAPEGVEYGIWTGEEIYQKIVPKEPIIEGIFNRGDHLLITSIAGTGKSILALQLVCNLTTGTDFLGTYHIPRPFTVLYVQTEGDRAETVHRLRHMCKALNIDDKMWAHYNAAGLVLNTDEGRASFIAKIRELSLSYEVIIIDPLYPTIKGGLTNDEVATDWQRSTRVVRAYYKTVSYIVFHHDTPKENWQDGHKVEKPPEDIFGTSMWSNWMSANYRLVKRDGKHILTGGKGGGRGRSGQGVMEIKMKLMEPSPLFYTIDEEGLNDTATKLLTMMLNDRTKRYRRTELEDIMGKSKATVCRALVVLRDKLDKVEEEGLTYYKAKEE